MKVLLVSEGKHELGDLAGGTESPLATLVSRTMNKPIEFTAKTVRDPAFGHVQGAGRPLFKRAVRCLDYAAKNGFDALVFVIDQDDEPGRRKHLDEAQEHLRITTPRAFGLAVRTFDAWMLADERALSKALDRVIQRQPDPESILDPKMHCRDICGNHKIGLTRLYGTIAAEADIAQIETRCPKGFAAFADRLKRI